MILNGPKLVNQVENLKNTKYHYSQPIVLNYDIANRHQKQHSYVLIKVNINSMLSL